MFITIKKILKALPLVKGLGWALCSVLLFAACTTQKTGIANNALTGKWQLKETLADIGDGKGTWTTVNKDSILISELKSDGSIIGNAMRGTTHYTITDSVHLAVTIEHNASPIDYRYKVINDTLILNPPCREACGMKFIRFK